MKAALATLLALAAAGAAQQAQAQDVGGGVDLDGEWHLGEGLGHGDYFRYSMCHVNYQECLEFEMALWISGDVTDGTESKWLAEAVVRDGNRVLKGEIHLGKVAPEPTGGSPELATYRGAFKSSVAWLSSFATSYGGEGGEGPKEFRAPSWGKIGNIGGQQVKPTALSAVATPAGVFDAVEVTWYTGGKLSRIWVVDGLPFPVKASTWTHVSSGIPPQEYRFELLERRTGVSEDPFAEVVPTEGRAEDGACPQKYGFAKERSLTHLGGYLLNVQYGPERPVAGCEVEWIVDFRSKFLPTEFLNQVQYDIVELDGESVGRSLAADQGAPLLFSPSGQVRLKMQAPGEPGAAEYAVVVYGLAPLGTVPDASPETLRFEVDVAPRPGGPGPEPRAAVPAWVRTTAGFWTGGGVSDAEFAAAIGYLVSSGVIDVPPTQQGDGGGAGVPAWVRTTTGYWVDGATSDAEFVGAVQFLIREGVIRLE